MHFFGSFLSGVSTPSFPLTSFPLPEPDNSTTRPEILTSLPTQLTCLSIHVHHVVSCTGHFSFLFINLPKLKINQPTNSVYNASKAAVIQLGRNLAAEWGQHGIRVNTISPGYIVTDMVRALFDKFPDREVEWPRQNMLGKLSRPEDYRGAAVFLLSDASRFMTGADLRIDGGHSAW